ncbi:MAG TPA: MmcQ/YjbR family DNA-binding protein [Micromonosporaceae bacterium]|nr:MmcQ/YjbR family DNA-binding protein [Micromonosporaceae bacterium]
MERLEEIVATLPEWDRVDIAAWDDQPTFRVRGKNFVFTDPEATRLTVKLTRYEAAAVVATDERVSPAGYGLGRHGWISIDLPPNSSDQRWREVAEWIRTSYTLVAPKRLALLVQAKEPDRGE